MSDTRDRTQDPTQRKYAAQRIESGLYLQPSNDAERFYVIAAYEDGRIHGLERGPWRATFWAWGELTPSVRERVNRIAEQDAREAVGHLRDVAQANIMCKTKREAIEEALAGDHRRAARDTGETA